MGHILQCHMGEQKQSEFELMAAQNVSTTRKKQDWSQIYTWYKGLTQIPP